MAEEVVGSFPFEKWAAEIRDALNGEGIDAEVGVAGPRAYPVYISEEDSERAQEVLSNIGYMTCETGSSLGLAGTLDWLPPEEQADRRRREEEEERLEELRSEVRSFMGKKIDDMANASAAQAWSNNEDQDVWMIAEFGDWTAVNGDLITEFREMPKMPEGFRKTKDGGDIPTTEEEVSLEHVMEAAEEEFAKSHPIADVKTVIHDIWMKDYHGRNVAYTSVSGDSEIYRKEGADE